MITVTTIHKVIKTVMTIAKIDLEIAKTTEIMIIDQEITDLKIVKEIIGLIIIAKMEIIDLTIEMVKDHLTEITMVDH